jgi:hypothetical protein
MFHLVMSSCWAVVSRVMILSGSYYRIKVVQHNV